MTDTYTPSQRFTKQQVATNRLVWGDILNSGFIDLLDEAIAGSASIDVTSDNVTLTDNDGASSQARAMTILVTGTPISVRTVFVPSRQKVYNVHNACGQTITVRTTGGVGVTVLNSTRVTVFVDELTDEVYHAQLHRSQTVAPNTAEMADFNGTVLNATGGTTSPLFWTHREGGIEMLKISETSVTVNAAAFVITGAFPAGIAGKSYHGYVREGTTAIEAVFVFSATQIDIEKSDGSTWTAPSTRVIFETDFLYRVD